jgi:hypothetical protein
VLLEGRSSEGGEFGAAMILTVSENRLEKFRAMTRWVMLYWSKKSRKREGSRRRRNMHVERLIRPLHQLHVAQQAFDLFVPSFSDKFFLDNPSLWHSILSRIRTFTL